MKRGNRTERMKTTISETDEEDELDSRRCEKAKFPFDDPPSHSVHLTAQTLKARRISISAMNEHTAVYHLHRVINNAAQSLIPRLLPLHLRLFDNPFGSLLDVNRILSSSLIPFLVLFDLLFGFWGLLVSSVLFTSFPERDGRGEHLEVGECRLVHPWPPISFMATLSRRCRCLAALSTEFGAEGVWACSWMAGLQKKHVERRALTKHHSKKH
ncbi:hypothetical protein FA10DRAFT_157135 [Acaromyces ingoldii]|uniref:Uncharacterized protein n=1 Tax=Acaromyces ingoldii TaxID=215250 RepID=A0A316YFM4_9BASI|nr:hypothetical protein FA10DRAFT_157135 [Acaromyces ingoldii]PWN88217.1 hypothetical protein FA10DRAFT_157135 [Acaromyces ingoldii]